MSAEQERLRDARFAIFSNRRVYFFLFSSASRDFFLSATAELFLCVDTLEPVSV
jgi:hypothetical protein